VLTPWRCHLKACPHRDKGRGYTKCSCPIWCDGRIDGKRIRKSLDTRDWARAMRKLGSIEDPAFGMRPCAQAGCDELVPRGRCARHTRGVTAAVVAYHASQATGAERRRTCRRCLQFLEDFLSDHGIATVYQAELEILNAFRSSRPVSGRTWAKELEVVRHFFRFCVDNEWVSRNWAEKVAMPKNLKPAEREPYYPNEIARIVAACDGIGRLAYERLRARAMILLLRHTALRISDVAMLRRDRVRAGEILLRTAKNGKPVKLPVHPELQAALDRLPLPYGVDAGDWQYYFWNGISSVRTHVRGVSQTLKAVYNASGVPSACSHRFRHTIATEVLELGGTIEEAADILGDSEAIVRKHYAKWSRGRQTRISELLSRLWKIPGPVLGTFENDTVQDTKNDKFMLVPGVGLEHVVGNDNREVIDSLRLTLSTLLTFEGFAVQNRVQGPIKGRWRDCAR
jgi:site-specific recombinase XerD